MFKCLMVLTLVFSMSVTAYGMESTDGPTLRDGFVLGGVDGKLISGDGNEISKSQCVSEAGFAVPERWFFKFDSNVSDEISIVEAGTAIELLPSSALERVTSEVEKNSEASTRLWGRVTEYNGRNFIFGFYFLPLSEVRLPESQEVEELRQTGRRPTINEPNDVLAVPQEIIEKLASRRIIRTEQLRKGLELKQDSILADRTGLLVRQGDGQLEFVLDAFGRGVQRISFRLLPCEALERAWRVQSAEPEPVQFKIAGIVTRYKDNHYLLLQRAIRVYSYENFGE
jgi:hypothetical protein